MKNLTILFSSIVFFFSSTVRTPGGEEVLLIGNSFTNSVFREVGLVALAKGKQLAVQKISKSATAWSYHLGQPATTAALGEKKWNWVVIQDYSNRPTHTGNVEQFKADGKSFYQKIRETAPQATIVLFQTWAYREGHESYTDTSTPKTFRDTTEMTAELVKHYTDLSEELEKREPGTQVRMAPVGAAFARCRELYPDLHLVGGDLKHAGDPGQYLAALVLYATLYQDSPVTADPVPGIKIDAQTSLKLQKIAEEVTASLRTNSTSQNP